MTVDPFAADAPRARTRVRWCSRYESLRTCFLAQGLDAVEQERGWTSLTQSGLWGLSLASSAARLQVESFEAPRPRWDADALDSGRAANLLEVFRRLSIATTPDVAMAASRKECIV
jgi:hypothetical protein